MKRNQGEEFERYRVLLFSIAYRMTGSASDAEDLVQETWLRYQASADQEIASLKAYLTTIITRLALDYLKSARVTREQYFGTWLPEPILTAEDGGAILERQESYRWRSCACWRRSAHPSALYFSCMKCLIIPLARSAEMLEKSPPIAARSFTGPNRRWKKNARDSVRSRSVSASCCSVFSPPVRLGTWTA